MGLIDLIELLYHFYFFKYVCYYSVIEVVSVLISHTEQNNIISKCKKHVSPPVLCFLMTCFTEFIIPVNQMQSNPIAVQ